MQHRYEKFYALELQSRDHLPRYNHRGVVEFRLQTDLLHVRKELSTGLLGTCVQDYTGAADYFWRNNTWRFSDGDYWRGVYRFLLTIGPRARSRIQSLDVLAPFAWRPDPYGHADRRFKNHRKMHRAKIWHDDRPLGLDRRDQVFALLMEEKSLHSLNRLVPAQFKLDKLSEDDCCWPGFVPLDFLPRI